MPMMRLRPGASTGHTKQGRGNTSNTSQHLMGSMAAAEPRPCSCSGGGSCCSTPQAAAAAACTSADDASPPSSADTAARNRS